MRFSLPLDQNTCAGYGSRCCKRHAGALSPSDIKGPMYRGLVELLSTGMYQIDWYDKNPMMSSEELRGYAITLQTGELKRIESSGPRHTTPAQRMWRRMGRGSIIRKGRPGHAYSGTAAFFRFRPTRDHRSDLRLSTRSYNQLRLRS